MKKRGLLLVLCAVLTLGAFGCGNNGGAASSSAAASSNSATKKYKIATDTAFAPFEFEDKDGKRVGIDMDLLEAIAKDQGFEYEINALGFDASLAAVQAGQADGMIAGMSITDKRKETFDFSEAYYKVTVTMAVKEGSNIKTFEDLKGKKVAIKTGTTGADVAKEIKDKYGFTVTEFKDSSDMYQDVSVGNSVACFEDYPVMAYAVQQNKNLKLTVVDTIAEKETPYGFAVKKGANAELIEKFNKGLENIKKNGVFDEIINRYTK